MRLLFDTLSPCSITVSKVRGLIWRTKAPRRTYQLSVPETTSRANHFSSDLSAPSIALPALLGAWAPIAFLYRPKWDSRWGGLGHSRGRKGLWNDVFAVAVLCINMLPSKLESFECCGGSRDLPRMLSSR